jgi:hypothetical protein
VTRSTWDLPKTDEYLDALRPIVKELEFGFPGSRLTSVRNQLTIAIDLLEQEQRELLFRAHSETRKKQ